MKLSFQCELKYNVCAYLFIAEEIPINLPF